MTLATSGHTTEIIIFRWVIPRLSWKSTVFGFKANHCCDCSHVLILINSRNRISDAVFFNSIYSSVLFLFMFCCTDNVLYSYLVYCIDIVFYCIMYICVWRRNLGFVKSVEEALENLIAIVSKVCVFTPFQTRKYKWTE